MLLHSARSQTDSTRASPRAASSGEITTLARLSAFSGKSEADVHPFSRATTSVCGSTTKLFGAVAPTAPRP